MPSIFLEAAFLRSLLALLAEIDVRKLYLGRGYSSMFVYCTQSLHLSESAAYARITAARASRSFPGILAHLTDGSVTLTTISLLAAHLTDENHEPFSVLPAIRAGARLNDWSPRSFLCRTSRPPSGDCRIDMSRASRHRRHHRRPHAYAHHRPRADRSSPRSAATDICSE